MNNPLLEMGLKRVAFVDDEKDDTLLDSIKLKGAGFQPLYIPGPFGSVSDLVDRVRKEADFVICDNALQPRNYAGFYGAEAVARWYDLKFPAILVTQFHADVDTSIRLWRRRVPVALDKKFMDVEPILSGVSTCLLEFDDKFTYERQAIRTLIKIARIDRDTQDAFGRVLTWDADQPIRFPIKLMPPILQTNLAVGQFFTALVNTGAKNADDIFFDDFQFSPEPTEELRFVYPNNP